MVVAFSRAVPPDTTGLLEVALMSSGMAEAMVKGFSSLPQLSSFLMQRSFTVWGR
ncbi:hypothetical protein D9M68_896650 [compost metagenome]